MSALQIRRTCGSPASPVLVGVHRLLQIRVEVLNGDWRATLPALVRWIERTCRGKGGFASGFYRSQFPLLEFSLTRFAEEEALKKRMAERSREFTGSELYAKA